MQMSRGLLRRCGAKRGELAVDTGRSAAFFAAMKKLLTLLAAVAAFGLSACVGGRTVGTYSVRAHKPANPANVRVKVSTSTQHIYVMEGNNLLMAVQGCVGANGSTGSGNYNVIEKIKDKRRISEPGAGYPMAYWVAWKSAYGFHEGFVHAVPRSHGCIRLHREAAARLFALTRIGTPVNIAATQPEDATYGRTVRHLDQSRDPDPPMEVMMSQNWFRDPSGPLLE